MSRSFEARRSGEVGMSLGPVSVASAAIHAGAVALLLVFPFVAQAPLPEPHTATSVDVTPLVVARPPHPPRLVPARPPSPSKAPAAMRPVVPMPTDVHEADAPPADSIHDQACSGCVFAATDEGPPDTGGRGESGIGPDAAPPAAPPALVRVSAGVEAPRKLVHVDPAYPELARSAGVQGIVRLECTIDPHGGIADVVVKSGHPLLVPAAEEAVRRWRYAPTRLNGVPVAVLMTVTVRFALPR
jgi:TonB family protein